MSSRYTFIENHYQDIKAKQSKLDVLINHAIDHLNDTYQLTVERARMEYDSDETLTICVKSKINEDVNR